jgi:hypothetical protein
MPQSLSACTGSRRTGSGPLFAFAGDREVTSDAVAEASACIITLITIKRQGYQVVTYRWNRHRLAGD